MKLLFGFLLVFVLCTSFKNTGDSVYVCDSKTSVAYHAIKNCKGLNKCTHEIIKVSKAEAVDVYKKRACKLCY
jgi:hypothetical protein